MIEDILNQGAPFPKGEVTLDVPVHITQEAYNKLRAYILECDTEISGFGKVRQFEFTERQWEWTQDTTRGVTYNKKPRAVLREYAKQGLQIYDVVIFKQEATSGHTTIDPETIAQFMTEQMALEQPIGDFKMWWHSHVDFGAHFSNTDLDTINGSTEFPYLISIVMNKKGESQSRLDINDKFFRFSYVDIKVEDNDDEALREEVREEIALKVTIPKPIIIKKGKQAILRLDRGYMGKKPWKQWEHAN